MENSREKELKFWVAFSSTGLLGPARFAKLLKFFNSLEKAYHSSRKDFLLAGLEENIVDQLMKRVKEIDPDKQMALLEKEGIRVILQTDPEYPALLSEIYQPPPLLYLKGSFENSDRIALSIVGARKATDYGKQAAADLALVLAAAGVTIVSGLALGIDTIAHTSALRAGGRTIGVLAGGIDRGTIYPPENKDLVEKIADGRGAVISEYAPYQLPLKQNFPARNRIIAGLSLGTLVVEAKENSGALITANCALEQGREVFAVPGSIYNKNSVGANNLIKMGAKLVMETNDILEELGLAPLKNKIAPETGGAVSVTPKTPEEAAILKLLSAEPIHINDLIKQTGFSPSVVNSTLILMELEGKVRNVGGSKYSVGKML